MRARRTRGGRRTGHAERTPLRARPARRGSCRRRTASLQLLRAAHVGGERQPDQHAASLASTAGAEASRVERRRRRQRQEATARKKRKFNGQPTIFSARSSLACCRERVRPRDWRAAIFGVRPRSASKSGRFPASMVLANAAANSRFQDLAGLVGSDRIGSGGRSSRRAALIGTSPSDSLESEAQHPSGQLHTRTLVRTKPKRARCQ